MPIEWSSSGMCKLFIKAVALVTTTAALCFGPAIAAEWPSGPVRIIVPFAAGGANDLLARAYGEVLSEAFGQQFFVENRTGGAGLIGTNAVAHAAPDGQVLLGSGMGALVVSPAMSPSPGYDALQDFTHIALFGGTPHVLVVHPQLGVKSFADLVAVARKERNGLGYLSASQGSPGNLVGELLSERQHLNLVHVSYRGAGQAINDLIGGHVKVGVITFSTARQHILNGTLLAVAVSTAERLPQMPEIPTFHELGMPELVTTSWYGLSGPAKMPSGIVTQLNKASNDAISSPSIQRIIREEAVQVVPMSPAEVTAYIKSDIEKWTPFATKMAEPR
jgi:tripartite-type tricarboxylate transporter receptor subunit TctC